MPPPCFRCEEPRAGRFRRDHRAGAEPVGSAAHRPPVNRAEPDWQAQPPSDPSAAPYPHLTWVDDGCCIPDLAEIVWGVGNEYTPNMVGAPTAYLVKGCKRHDFAWRNLWRIEHYVSKGERRDDPAATLVDSWNSANQRLTNDRLEADWHQECNTVYAGDDWGLARMGCLADTTAAKTRMAAAVWLVGYSTDNAVGYQ